MDSNFPACLDVILASERGYWVDPRGGPTNLGVTQRTLSVWLKRSASVDEVKALTPATVAPLYQVNYFNVAHCPDLPVGVDLMVFDQAVNEGPGTAVRHLQTAAGVSPDGLWGPLTAAAIARADVPTLIATLHDNNADFYKSLNDPRFLAGWLARNDRTRDAALRMASTTGGAPTS